MSINVIKSVENKSNLYYSMLKDHNHDLVQQLSEISDSLWRIGAYMKTAEGCSYCFAMWDELRQDYEKHTAMLTDEIKRHVKEERFN